jgi:glycerol uptake facilitator-like aquaporin
VVSAFVFEVIGTFLFLVCILGVTHPFAPTSFAGRPMFLGRPRRGTL